MVGEKASIALARDLLLPPSRQSVVQKKTAPNEHFGWPVLFW
jgi:hypothetical protein